MGSNPPRGAIEGLPRPQSLLGPIEWANACIVHHIAWTNTLRNWNILLILKKNLVEHSVDSRFEQFLVGHIVGYTPVLGRISHFRGIAHKICMDRDKHPNMRVDRKKQMARGRDICHHRFSISFDLGESYFVTSSAWSGCPYGAGFAASAKRMRRMSLSLYQEQTKRGYHYIRSRRGEDIILSEAVEPMIVLVAFKTTTTLTSQQGDHKLRASILAPQMRTSGFSATEQINTHHKNPQQIINK